MKEKLYYEIAIDAILEMIKNNIIIYYTNSDSLFPTLREYCKSNSEDKGKNIEYYILANFTKEVMRELLSCKHLYDFRALD